MAQDIVVFKDFSGGDPGRTRPDQNGDTFRGLNVWKYGNGIGPRPPFQAMGITGLPVGKLATFNVLKVSILSTNLVFAYDASPSPVWWCRRVAGNGAFFAGNLTNKPVKGINSGPDIHWVSPAGPGGTVDIDGTLFAQTAAMPSGVDIVVYGEVEAIGRHLVDIHEAKLLWSTIQDPYAWPAANTFDVGLGKTIQAMYVQRNTLVLLMRDGTIWTVTGVLGVNETLRVTEQTIPHAAGGEATGAVVNGASLFYCSGMHVVQFTGAKAELIPRPDLPAPTGFLTKPWAANPGHVLPLPGDDDFLLVGTLDKDASPTSKTIWAQAYRDGAWTRHHIPVTEYVNSAESAKTAVAVRTCPEYVGDLLYVVTSSSTASPKVYQLDARQQFPHKPIGTPGSSTFDDPVSWTLNDADSAAPTVADVAFEQWHPEGAQVTVRSVLVDYSYDPAHVPFSTYSKFDISAEALQNQGSATTRRSAIQTFTPLASGSTPDGEPLVRGQARFQMGEQGSGVGFRIRLDDWRGILVHRISVIVDEAPVRV